MKITKAITNCQLVLERGILWDATLLLSDDKIAALGAARETEIPEGAEIIDAGGRYVGPGFIDIHVHGGNGHLTYREPVEAAKYFLSHGETSILATPSYDIDFQAHMDAIKTVKEKMAEAKTIKGIYFEGPYTNTKYGSGAFKNPWRHPIDPNEYKSIIDAAGDLALVWTFAPELEGVEEVVKYAKKVNPNAIIAMGHSDATPAQARALGKNRPTLMTHTMNATGMIPTYGGTRAFGPDEYTLSEPEVYAEMISDSLAIHVPPELQRYILKGKGLDRVILITDCTYYENPAPEHYKHVTDLNFDERGGIAGSKVTLDKACRNVMAHTNCGICEAFIMASTNPAKLLGFYNEIGSIDVGKTADLVIVDDKFNVDKVLLGGEVCEF